jgi:hypothetical protein
VSASLNFLFVQFEFTHAIGPHAARYIVEPCAPSGARPLASEGAEIDSDERSRTVIEARNEQVAGVRRGIGAADVLVVGVVPAPATRPRLLRRARYVDAPESNAPVPLSLVTFVKGTVPLSDKQEADRHLDAVRVSEESQDELVAEALAVLNLAIRAYRVGAHDPYAIEVTRRDARAVRIGYGSTEEVQEGRWRVAVELAPPRGRRAKRVERLRPAEAVAAVLSRRTTILEGEDLLSRALIDLDNQRTRAAAFQVAAAIRLLPTEVDPDSEPGPGDLLSVQQHASRVGELEASAGRRALDDAEVVDLEAIIDAVEAVLDERRYGGAGASAPGSRPGCS